MLFLGFEEDWDVLRHLQFKDPAFGFLMTLEKARRGEAGRRGEQGVEIVPAHNRSTQSNERRNNAQRPRLRKGSKR